jgi:hypothetical protein
MHISAAMNEIRLMSQRVDCQTWTHKSIADDDDQRFLRRSENTSMEHNTVAEAHEQIEDVSDSFALPPYGQGCRASR